VTLRDGRWGARIDGCVLALAAGLVAALAFLAPRATVPALFTILAVVGVNAAIRRTRLVLPSSTSLAVFAALIGWAALSALWSGAPGATLRAVAGLAILLCTGLFLIAHMREADGVDRAQRGLCAGIGVGLFFYAFEWISGGWLIRTVHGLAWRDIIDLDAGGTNVSAYFINGTAILSLLLWPLLVGCHRLRRWPVAFALAAGIAIVTLEFGSDSGMLAIAVGAICWFAAVYGGRWAARVVAIVFVLVILAFPFAFQRGVQAIDLDRVAMETAVRIPSSALLRIYIWKFATAKIAEHPIIGWGFDTARSIPGGGDRFTVKDANGNIVLEEFNLPLHPHNQILQIWLELGAIGALIVAICGGILIDRIGRWPLPSRAGGLALVGNALVYDGLSFGAWQSWWIAAVLLAAILVSAQARVSR
jgi:O-antigen ligase